MDTERENGFGSKEDLSQLRRFETAQPVSLDASYEVFYKDEGVFIEVTYEQGEGETLNPSIVTYDLSRRNIRGLDVSSVLVHIRKREALIKIAEKQDEAVVDSEVTVVISKDAMSAQMTLLPPSPSGNHASFEDVLNKVKQQWNIVYGLDEAAIQSAVVNKTYFKPIQIAEGKPAQKGADGYLNFLFKTVHSYTPVIASDGSTDYRNLDLFENVLEGAPVVVKVPPEQGEDGFTVNGDILPAKSGVEAKLPAGKNTLISEDGQCLIAAKSGRIDYVGGRVDISDVYKIPGNVDMSVGNIKFEGDVLIGGHIIAGLTVQASGSIEVSDYVEGAMLIAEKDIILKNGINGQDIGRLMAGGNIVAKYIENCSVEARGDVVSDYIVHCNVLAGGSVTMKGSWGKLIGGTVRACKEVSASMIGSPLHDSMTIELGVAPEIRAKYVECDAKRSQIKAQLQKIENLARMSSAGVSPDRLAMRQRLLDAKDQLEQQYNEVVGEIAAYEEILSQLSGARVNVTKCIYPGVKIIIDSAVFTTKSTHEYATFKNQYGEVTFTACEVLP